uniref:PPP1R35_C domain-containing protein n=1 Tax=Strongyloides venezuelensis TaxID=75913 RepID=A0A0K0FCY9_STRVS
MFHSRKELPLASIKSPRRNTAITDLESLSSNLSLDGTIASKLSITKSRESSLKADGLRKYSATRRQSDYLHPKYSLPPIKIQLDDNVLLMEFENCLRTPIDISLQSSRNNSAKHSPIAQCSIENEEEDCYDTSVKKHSFTDVELCERIIPIQDSRLLTVPNFVNVSPLSKILQV